MGISFQCLPTQYRNTQSKSTLHQNPLYLLTWWTNSLHDLGKYTLYCACTHLLLQLGCILPTRTCWICSHICLWHLHLLKLHNLSKWIQWNVNVKRALSMKTKLAALEWLDQCVTGKKINVFNPIRHGRNERETV